jgi:hypothetical protein
MEMVFFWKPRCLRKKQGPTLSVQLPSVCCRVRPLLFGNLLETSLVMSLSQAHGVLGFWKSPRDAFIFQKAIVKSAWVAHCREERESAAMKSDASRLSSW